MNFYDFRMPRQQRPVRTREKRFVLKDLAAEPELFSGSEITFVDEFNGVQTVLEQSIYHAGCGHFIGLQSPAELSSSCEICGASLCFRVGCGDRRCGRCSKIICQSCAKLVDYTDYCQRCRTAVLLKQIFLNFGGLLHGLLSKDFS